MKSVADTFSVRIISNVIKTDGAETKGSILLGGVDIGVFTLRDDSEKMTFLRESGEDVFYATAAHYSTRSLTGADYWARADVQAAAYLRYLVYHALFYERIQRLCRTHIVFRPPDRAAWAIRKIRFIPSLPKTKQLLEFAKLYPNREILNYTYCDLVA